MRTSTMLALLVLIISYYQIGNANDKKKFESPDFYIYKFPTATKKIDIDFLEAAKTGNSDTIRNLLKVKGLNKDSRDENGETALHLATKNKHHDTVRLLLRNGFNANLKDNKGETALYEAITINHFQLAQTLIDEGAQVNIINANFETPLHYAAWYRNDVNIINLILDKNANVYARDKWKQPPIYYTLIKRDSDQNDKARLDAFKSILHRYEKNKLTYKEGKKRLIHRAIIDENNNFYEELLGKGARLDEIDHKNTTSLHFAALSGKEQLVKDIIKGESIYSVDKSGMSPLGYAYYGLSITNNKKKKANLRKIIFRLKMYAPDDLKNHLGLVNESVPNLESIKWETDLSNQYRKDIPVQTFGSCHIFATTALYEAACFRATGKKVDISEPFMFCCHLIDRTKCSAPGVMNKVSLSSTEAGNPTNNIINYCCKRNFLAQNEFNNMEEVASMIREVFKTQAKTQMTPYSWKVVSNDKKEQNNLMCNINLNVQTEMICSEKGSCISVRPGTGIPTAQTNSSDLKECYKHKYKLRKVNNPTGEQIVSLLEKKIPVLCAASPMKYNLQDKEKNGENGAHVFNIVGHRYDSDLKQYEFLARDSNRSKYTRIIAPKCYAITYLVTTNDPAE